MSGENLRSKKEPTKMVPDIIQVSRNTRYPLEAFVFVQRGLEFTVRRLHGAPDERTETTSHHVTGHDLCTGLRDYAIQEYGLLARMVLRRWNITSSEDFGQIVFAMVDAKLLAKTDEDSIEDFRDIFDFEHAFAERLSLSENS